jgi:DNA-binding HxlR family transcriptional regulator
LRVVWELHLGAKTFRALQEACDDLSPTVVNARVGELRAARLVELLPGQGYALTRRGAEMVAAFGPLMKWGVRWQRELRSK